MSSSVCPLPARMEAFTTRMCLRAADQYERLLQIHFNKAGKNHQPRINKEIEMSKKNDIHNEYKNNEKINNGYNYSSIIAFRQWKKNDCINNNNNKQLNNIKNINNKDIEKFPLAISDTAMMDVDVSLKYLALNALDLTVPASDILLKNRLKSWFQLSGHPDGFAPAGPGTVWKRLTGGCENNEVKVYEELTNDNNINNYIPKYYRQVDFNNDKFIELQDLLFGFNDPYVMDIKLGTRTFLETEVSKKIARNDLYEKMISVDPNEPNYNEHCCKAITKLRYMLFREQQSSTCSHGFRIEAMKLAGKEPITNLKTVKHHNHVFDTMKFFINNRKKICQDILIKLNDLRCRIESSVYFQTHEIIGSSIFMIFDNEKVGIWLIDFAKTQKVPDGIKLNHRTPWENGNHEDGFLFGLDNLINIIQQVYDDI